MLRSPDGTRCATYTSDGLAHLWELATGTHVRAFIHEQALLSAACFTPDGSRLVVTSSNGHLWVWDVARGERVAKGFARDYWFQHLVPLADGRRMISGASNRQMAIWDLERGEPELFAGPPVQVSALALTPDERFAVTSVFELDKPGSLQVWDVASRSRVAELKAEDKTSFGCLVLADAGRLAVAAGRGGQLMVVSLPDAAIVHALPGRSAGCRGWYGWQTIGCSRAAPRTIGRCCARSTSNAGWCCAR
ncbi:WD40 repeat domain-containing protein [Nannocystis pusilla]|uniref:WD40 repeat domain-containing protein n=1 Tax=Nannocystis pusilla TaxID=889268 RepID=UPI003B7CB3B5